MVPGWLSFISNLWPIWLFLAIGMAIFGFSKIRAYIAQRNEEKEEEERRRKEFLAKMSAKLKVKS